MHQNERKFPNMTKSRLAAVVAAVLMLIAGFAADVSVFASNCEKLRNDVFRLHVIANSDSDADQSVKLQVRDMLLEITKDRIGDAADKNAVEAYFEKNSGELTEKVNAFLAEKGFDYGAKISISRSYFETREYDGNTLPAGDYDALKVVLGKGDGRNWWCVMFPPLCVSAADGDELPPSEYKFMQSGGGTGYRIKLKVVEWFRAIFK